MMTLLKSTFVDQLVFLLMVAAPMVLSKGYGELDDSPQARALYHLADIDGTDYLTYGEFQHLFRSFDDDSDGNVTNTEFLNHWHAEQLGPTDQGHRLFLNFDVTKSNGIDISHDVQFIFIWFDINENWQITEGEFVIQWVKISS